MEGHYHCRFGLGAHITTRIARATRPSGKRRCETCNNTLTTLVTRYMHHRLHYVIASTGSFLCCHRLLSWGRMPRRTSTLPPSGDKLATPRLSGQRYRADALIRPTEGTLSTGYNEQPSPAPPSEFEAFKHQYHCWSACACPLM